MSYTPPISDISFALLNVADLGNVEGLAAYTNYDADLLEPVLDEAGKLARDVIAPLNQSGDKEGAQLTDTGVKPASGFAEAYAAYRDGGWMGISFPEIYGGQGLPKAVALAVMEMFHASNMAFALCPMLSFGAIEALLVHGREDQKARYLPKLVSGDWTGTMNLTEPQAGSDVGALKTKAVPNGDGTYNITGQKIYITWGDHDMTENIIHLVLARLPDAPSGSAGISLFLCPKFLLNDDGTPGARNRVRCIGLENKIGIHASPTCVMEFDGAKAELIGEPNRGLAAMFTMMNSARLNVGLEGVAVADAAFQAAKSYAEERKQGKVSGVEGPAAIINHPDVKRMLATMKVKTMASRAICYACGVAADLAENAATEEARESAKLREDVLTPIAKAWSTDIGVETASLGVQIHGGMGFMNETLAAQLYRDARIAPIYEGTNGIQAMDLVGRKLSLADGRAMSDLIIEMRQTAEDAGLRNTEEFVQLADLLNAATDTLEVATGWMRNTMKTERDHALAGASSYLKLTGDTLGGHYLIKGALSENSAEMASLASYYGETILASVPGSLPGVTKAGMHLSSL